MKKYRFLWIILLLAAIITVGGYSAINYPDNNKRQPEEPYFGETTIIDKISMDEFSSEVTDLIREYDGTKISSDASSNPYYSRRLIVQGKKERLDLSEFGAKIVVQGPDNMYVMQFTTQEAAQEACSKLQNSKTIRYCEPDQYVHSGENDNDYTAMSWGAKQIGADVYAKHIKSITEDAITVAVIDTGVYKHSFLKDRILPEGRDYIDNDTNPNDEHSHGTHVAGTIVDCTPGLNVMILPVRVLGADGSGSSLTVSLGVIYAADYGAQVINLSLWGETSQTIDNAVRYAIRKGCIVVTIAGNANQDTANTSPAHLDKCIVVSAIDNNLSKAEFSNWGNSVDFAGPGVGIKSCVPKLFLKHAVGETTEIMDGTSMAAPHITALAAMIKLEHPSMTQQEVQNTIAKYCVDLGEPGWDPYFGWGMPNFTEATNGIKPELAASEPMTQTDPMIFYEKILAEYKFLARNNFSTSYRGKTKYVNDGVWNFSGQWPCSVYYRFADLANDGFPELLISINKKVEPYNIVDIFGNNNGKPAAIIKSDGSVGYRSRYYITKDNKIKNPGSGGALNASISYYRLLPNSTLLEDEDYYIYDGWNGDQYTHVNSSGISENISRDEYMSVFSDNDLDTTSEWELLYDESFAQPDKKAEENPVDIAPSVNTNTSYISSSAYQGIFMQNDTFISLSLYTFVEPESAVGVAYRVSKPARNQNGYIKSDIIEILGEIYSLASEGNYEIRNGDTIYGLSYYEREIKLTGTAPYNGIFTRVSNSGANVSPADIWLNIPEQSGSSSVLDGETSSAQQNNTVIADSSEYILPNSDSVKITRDQLAALSSDQLRIARNEIYARHGRRFTSPDLQQYFDSKSWYTPRYTPEEFEKIQYDILNQTEWENINLILEAETP